jgi:hypothetical protein
MEQLSWMDIIQKVRKDSNIPYLLFSKSALIKGDQKLEEKKAPLMTAFCHLLIRFSLFCETLAIKTELGSTASETEIQEYRKSCEVAHVIYSHTFDHLWSVFETTHETPISTDSEAMNKHFTQVLQTRQYAYITKEPNSSASHYNLYPV